MWLLAHQKRNSGIVQSHRSIHHPSSGRVSHHLFSLFSLFLKIIHTYREGGKISIASHLKDIVRGRTRLQKIKGKGRNKETKDLGGWMKETINCMAGKEENDVWRNRSMRADYRYSFSSFSPEFLRCFKLIYGPCLDRWKAAKNLVWENLKKTEKISYLFLWLSSQRSPVIPEKMSQLIVRPSLLFLNFYYYFPGENKFHFGISLYSFWSWLHFHWGVCVGGVRVLKSCEEVQVAVWALAVVE